MGNRKWRAACLLALSALAWVPARGADAPEPREAAVARQLRQQEALLLLARGRRLLAAGTYGEAIEALRHAHRLAPDNPSCRKLLAQAQAALRLRSGQALGRAQGGASRPAATRGVLEPIRQRRAFQAQNLVRQAELSLFEATQALKARNFDRAIQYARRATETTQFVEDADQSRRLRTRADTILAAAGKALKRDLAARRQRDLARARADAQGERRRRTAANAGRIRALREKAWKLQEDGEHEKVIALAEQMLELDPTNDHARFLKEEAGLASLGPSSLRGRSPKRRKLVSRFLDAIEEELAPPAKADILLPGKGKGRHAARLQEQPLEPWERDLKAKLAEDVAVEFRSTPIGDVVKQLAAIGKINIVLDPAATADTPVTMQRTRMPLEATLRWVARFGGLRYCLRDGAVYLATARGILDEPVRRIYDVSALVIPRGEGVPTAVLGPLEPFPQKPTPKTTKPTAVDVNSLGEGWADFLRTTVAPGTWDRRPEEATLQEAPSYSIQYRNGRIVVLHTPDVQKQIEHLLNNFRRARSLQVHILCRYLQISRTYLDRLVLNSATWVGPDATGPGHDPTGGKRYAFPYIDLQTDTDVLRAVSDPLDPGADPIMQPLARFPDVTPSGGLALTWAYSGVFGHNAQAVLNTILKEQDGTVLTAPRITCFNTQRANIQVLVNHNYVRRISSDEEPEIGNVPSGIIFDVQPFVSSDRRYITLVLQPQRRELLQMTTYSFSLGVDQDVPPDWVGPLPTVGRSIQLPTTRLESLGTTVTVPNGGTLMVGGFTEAEERRGVASIPFIDTIPILRTVLRGWDRAEGRRSLILLITAETVKDLFSEED